MFRWRLTALILLAALVGLPLVWPALALLAQQQRLGALAANTALLVGGTLLLALPAGVAGAVLLYRTDLPFPGVFRFVAILGLFVPLPVLTTAWQAAIGSGPGSLLGLWQRGQRPWAEGLGPAIWIHAQAALPWVVAIVGHGLRWVEADLEEDALLAGSAWSVLWRVTLPRAGGSILAAAAWVGLQVSTELTVADLMLVRTFAEEVYAQFWQGGAEALGRAVAASLPFILLGGGAVTWALLRLERVVPPLQSLHAPPRLFPLGRARWLFFLLAAGALLLVAGVPLWSLVRKTGATASGTDWSATFFWQRMGLAVRSDWMLVAKSLLTVALSGGFIASVALVLCWLTVNAPRWRLGLFAVLAIAWSMPGPIVGIGLKETILSLVVWLPWPPVSILLHEGPESPVPVIWAHLLRFLPCAVAILWPVVRAMPAELRENLQTEGATPVVELWHLIIPLSARAWSVAALVIAAQAIGEIGAVAMGVETPRWQMFAHVLFNRMHYGLQSDVSALCLLLIFSVALLGALFALARELIPRLAAATRRLRRAGR